LKRSIKGANGVVRQNATKTRETAAQLVADDRLTNPIAEQCEGTPTRQEQKPNLGRHKRNCSVCGHEKLAEIEADFITWKSPAAIAQEHGLADRTSVYRHAHALGLFPKRRRNVRAALEKIIEKAGDVDVTAPAVVAAVQAYSKINTAGQWVDRSEHVDLNALFEKMTAQEMEAYAQNGTLPAWFTGTVGATLCDGLKE
jgi:hypothetical protein